MFRGLPKVLRLNQTMTDTAVRMYMYIAVPFNEMATHSVVVTLPEGTELIKILYLQKS